MPSRLTFDPAIDFRRDLRAVRGLTSSSRSPARAGLPSLLASARSPRARQRGSRCCRVVAAEAPRATGRATDGSLVYFGDATSAPSWDIEIMPMAGGRVRRCSRRRRPRAQRAAVAGWPLDGVHLERERQRSRSTCSRSRRPAPNGRSPKGGGLQPQWRRDGRELFYIAPDKKLMGVAVQTGSAFVPGAATALVETRITAWERSNHGVQTRRRPTASAFS